MNNGVNVHKWAQAGQYFSFKDAPWGKFVKNVAILVRHLPKLLSSYILKPRLSIRTEHTFTVMAAFYHVATKGSEITSF